MSKKIRNQRCDQLYMDLNELRSKLMLITPDQPDYAKKIALLRASMTCIEHQVAIVRLSQGEERLLQYFWRAIFGLLGAGVGWFLTLVGKV
jgi:hypothetical protein